MGYSESLAGTTPSSIVVPAEAGTHFANLRGSVADGLDSCFRGSGCIGSVVQPLAATPSVRNHHNAFLTRAGVWVRHGVPLPARQRGCRRNSGRVTAATLLGLCVVLWAGCSPNKAGTPGMPPDYSAPVTTATAALATVPIQVHAIGNVEAYSTVSVKAQVAARVEKAYFTEGQDVRKSDLLFTLDRRPFDTALRQAEANLAKDQAQLENAKAEADRYTKLFQEGIVSKEQYDSMRTNADALAASVSADKAAIERARIDLSYCTIQAPVGGRTGALLVHPGNLVKENDAALVVLNQIHPIYVTFSVPEQHLAEIKRYRAEGPLQVEATIPNQEQNPAKGVLTFIDNAVDSSTGTIKLKATFENPDNRLWPGQFVNVALTLTTQPNAVVVPSQAVQTGQVGQYVFVVKPDMTAEYRPMIAGDNIAGEAVVQKGLQAGETVVTDGQLRLVPGMKVAIKKQ